MKSFRIVQGLLGLFAVCTFSLSCSASAQSMANHSPGMFCCAIDDFDMLPERTRERLLEQLAEQDDSPSLTLVPVEIDSLGADPDTPWLVFAEALSIRNAPSLLPEQSQVIGQLPNGTRIVGQYKMVAESDQEWLKVYHNGGDAFVHRMGLTRAHPSNVGLIGEHGDLPLGEEIVNRWWGIPIDYEASDLVEIPFEYTNQMEGRDYQLRRAAVESMIAMMDDARADGVYFYASSPYRSGERQVNIYTRNITRNPAQRSSAPPGHSEHQLGTTVDFATDTRENGGRFLNNTNEEWFWLRDNGHRYGWRQTYTADNIEATGYIEEPWHWRFFGMPE